MTKGPFLLQLPFQKMAAPPISITTRYLESKTPGLPALVLQVTSLVDSYMVWVGISSAGPEAKERTVAQGLLCRDWAVAMPPRPVGDPLTTECVPS